MASLKFKTIGEMKSAMGPIGKNRISQDYWNAFYGPLCILEYAYDCIRNSRWQKAHGQDSSETEAGVATYRKHFLEDFTRTDGKGFRTYREYLSQQFDFMNAVRSHKNLPHLPTDLRPEIVQFFIRIARSSRVQAAGEQLDQVSLKVRRLGLEIGSDIENPRIEEFFGLCAEANSLIYDRPAQVQLGIRETAIELGIITP